MSCKIYKVFHPDEPNLIYIGSTSGYLCQRMANHRSHFRMYRYFNKYKTTLFDIFDKYDCNDCIIESIESCSNVERYEREKYYIQNLECVNKNIPSRTIKEYYEDNKADICLKKKEYYIHNREVIKTKNLARYYVLKTF